MVDEMTTLNGQLFLITFFCFAVIEVEGLLCVGDSFRTLITSFLLFSSGWFDCS